MADKLKEHLIEFMGQLIKEAGYELYMPRPGAVIDESWAKYKKKSPVWAKQIDKPFSVDTLEGDDIAGKAGDYLCVGVEGERWPIDKDIFEKTYTKVEDSEPPAG